MGFLSKLNQLFSTLQALKAEITESKSLFDDLKSRVSTPSLPVSNPTLSSWQDDPLEISTQPLPTTAEIIIIGSGISGASIAYTLLKKCPSSKIVMLEAREICSGATGRNGGHIKCSAYMEYSTLKARFGNSAKQLLRYQKRHMPLLLGLIEELKIEAEAREVETVDVFTDEKAWEDAKQMVKEFKTDMPEEAEDIIVYDGVDGCQEYHVNPAHCCGIITYKAAALSPYKFIVSLYTILLQNPNFTISSGTAVTEITSPDKYTVFTGRGKICASSIVHATDGFAATLIPGLEGKIFPVRGHVTTQSGCGFDASRSWCIHHKRGFDYISQRPGGELVVGGGMIQSPGRGVDEFGIWRDDGICYSIRAYLGGLVETVFETQTKTERAWSGCMGFTPDLLPFVGRLESSMTGRRSDGEWISAGFQGEGMVLAWLSGVAVGLMIAGDQEYQDEAGIPGGRVQDWLPRELICSKERVDRLIVSDLAALL
ncbi:unnamed protein product [Penicillium olsonii]|nr:unnamed protein product [Penicillium olsonii]CAG7933591.1 unnamed protein product [Penicillium olsonii]